MTLLRATLNVLIPSLLGVFGLLILLVIASIRLLPAESAHNAMPVPNKHAHNLYLISQQLKNATQGKKPNNTLRFSQGELNSINHIVHSKFNALSMQVDLGHQSAKINLFYTLIQWENKKLGFTFETQLLNSAHAFTWQNTYLANWPLPSQSINWLFDYLLTQMVNEEIGKKIRSQISAINITDQALTFNYAHQQDIASIKKQVLKKHQTAQINLSLVQKYLLSLQVLQHSQRDPLLPLTLADVMQSLFTQALLNKPSSAQHAIESAIEENKAILQALAIFTMPLQFKHFYAGDLHAFKLQEAPLKLSFHHREDLAKHFIASAAINLLLNQHTSTQIGELKELFDSQIQDGSGFSFDDIAADRAGIHFAKQATLNSASAQHIQRLFSLKGIQENDLLPKELISNTSLSEAEFVTRYQSTHTKTYKKQLETIDNAILTANIYTVN